MNDLLTTFKNNKEVEKSIKFISNKIPILKYLISTQKQNMPYLENLSETFFVFEFTRRKILTFVLCRNFYN